MTSRILLIISLIVSVLTKGSAQEVKNEEFQQKLQRLLSFSVPTIDVDEAYEHQADYIFLDAREQSEFDVSHIPEARYIGYKDFDINALKDISLDQALIIYCSVGYRSEKIAEKLQKGGYNNVYNLYGSLFEWVNQGYPIENVEGVQTQAVHTYNRKWSKWVNNPSIKKKW